MEAVTTEKLCVAVVANRKYQKYMPIFAYFCLVSYPDYGVKIFLTEELLPKYKEIASTLKSLGDLVIVENAFANFPKTNQELKTLRWIITPEMFDGYDNVYMGDVDLLICREADSLEKQHLEHCERNGLPYSNSVRPSSKRLSGLHFVKKIEYYEKMSPVIQEYKLLLKDGKLKNTKNEEILYRMIKKAGFSLPKGWFRPHHGLHLGLWRKGPRKIISNEFWNLASRDKYAGYYKFFKEVEKKDLYKEIYNVQPLSEIKYMKRSLNKEI